MSEVSGKDLIGVFTPWITQPCFPWITVKRQSSNKYHLVQNCFKDQSDSLSWPIPISFISVQNGVKGSFIMTTKEFELEVPDLQEDDFLKFNHNHSGLYITRYAVQGDEEEETYLKEIQGLLTHSSRLSGVDRYGLLSDIIISGHMLPAMFQYFENEQDIGVWYLLYGYLKNDLMFAENQIRLFDTYRSQALPSLSLVALQSITHFIELS